MKDILRLMVMGTKRTKVGIDWITLLLWISILTLGWFAIIASEYTEQESWSAFSLSHRAGKQLLWIGISSLFFIVIQLIDLRFWRTFAYPLYFFSLLLLVGLFVFGTSIKGATSWYLIGSFQFQPSELTKFTTALALAAYLSYYKTDIRERHARILALSIFILPMALIFLQPDAGSGLVFLSFFLLLYRAGLPGFWYLLVGMAIATVICSLLFESQIVIYSLLCVTSGIIIYFINRPIPWIVSGILLAITGIVLIIEGSGWFGVGLMLSYALTLTIVVFLKKQEQMVIAVWPLLILFGIVSVGSEYAFDHLLAPHQKDRINVWLQPEECDPRGSLYNVLQSKMAIGSGGISGKGYLEGTMTRFNYVPEQSTDFIFCTIGEEFGFWGSAAVIGLFLLLLLRLTQIAERTRTAFDRYYIYAIVGILFVHVFINIGMTMGLVPIIGIPLPFVSYGGSSLLIFSLMMALVLKMDQARRSY